MIPSGGACTPFDAALQAVVRYSTATRRLRTLLAESDNDGPQVDLRQLSPRPDGERCAGACTRHHEDAAAESDDSDGGLRQDAVAGVPQQIPWFSCAAELTTAGGRFLSLMAVLAFAAAVGSICAALVYAACWGDNNAIGTFPDEPGPVDVAGGMGACASAVADAQVLYATLVRDDITTPTHNRLNNR
eukprot:1192454-Prorocentrum_minimum.AAC.3